VSVPFLLRRCAVVSRAEAEKIEKNRLWHGSGELLIDAPRDLSIFDYGIFVRGDRGNCSGDPRRRIVAIWKAAVRD
jgi:hypothetical protein